MRILTTALMTVVFLVLTACSAKNQPLSDIKADDGAVVANQQILGPQNVPDYAIRDLTIFNHFDHSKLAGRTIGIECELGGMPPEKAIEILVQELGGKFIGEITHGTEKAFMIQNTVLGDIRIEPVNLMRILNRINQTNPKSLS